MRLAGPAGRAGGAPTTPRTEASTPPGRRPRGGAGGGVALAAAEDDGVPGVGRSARVVSGAGVGTAPVGPGRGPPRLPSPTFVTAAEEQARADVPAGVADGGDPRRVGQQPDGRLVLI